MKKTEYITFRTDQSTKEALESIAAEKKWTISQLTAEVMKEYTEEQSKEHEEKGAVQKP